MSDDEIQGRFEPVMPFTVVKSVGGPYDDAAFVAGWNMGRLDLELAQLTAIQALPRPRYISTPLQEQVDLLAMKHGYLTKFTPWIDHPDEWVRVDFRYPGTKEDSDG